jgi:hypothetical protein
LAKKENSRGTDLVQQVWRVRKDTCSILTVLCFGGLCQSSRTALKPLTILF